MNRDLIVLSTSRRPYRDVSDDDLASLIAGAELSKNPYNLVETRGELATRLLLARNAEVTS